MASRPENEPFIPPNTPELIQWVADEPGDDRTGLGFLLLHNLKEILYRISGFSVPFLISFGVGVVAAITLEIEGVASISITILVFAASIGVTAISLMVWRIGRWFRVHFRNHWHHQIPTHDLDVSGLNRLSLQRLYEYTTYRLQLDCRYEQTTRPSSTSLYVGCWLLFLGYTAQLLFILILVVMGEMNYFSNLHEITVGSNVSTLAAFLSPLLGPLVGVVTVSLASISSSLDDFVLFSFLFVLPAYFIAPGVQNIIEWSEVTHREWANHFAETDDIDSKEKTIHIIVLGLLYGLLDSVLLYLLGSSL